MSEIRYEHPRLGMKFHAFLVNIGLFAHAALTAASGAYRIRMGLPAAAVPDMAVIRFDAAGKLVTPGQTEARPAFEYFASGPDWLQIALGAVLILLALYALFVRTGLKRLRARAPFRLFLLYVGLAAVYFMQLVFRFTAEWALLTLPFLVLPVALGTAARIYYNKRDFLFTN